MGKDKEIFDINRSDFDLTTFSGRCMHFLSLINPITLLESDDNIMKAQNMLNEYKMLSSEEEKYSAIYIDKKYSMEGLESAKKLVDATVHPYTNTIIPAYFRMSSFIPMNIPIIYGMMNTTATLPMLGWHWVNQSYNTAVNYSNRSGDVVDTKSIMESYALAVLTSCSLAGGLGKAAERGLIPGLKHPAIVSYIAVAGAGSSNIMFSRKGEMIDGAPMTDEDGTYHGKSPIAGKSIVYQTVFSRGMFVPMPVLLLPTSIMYAMKKVKMVPKNPQLKMFLEMGVIVLSLGGALPVAMSIFPQRAEFNACDLEPQFQHLVKKNGEKVQKLYTNKGL